MDVWVEGGGCRGSAKLTAGLTYWGGRHPTGPESPSADESALALLRCWQRVRGVSVLSHLHWKHSWLVQGPYLDALTQSVSYGEGVEEKGGGAVFLLLTKEQTVEQCLHPCSWRFVVLF